MGEEKRAASGGRTVASDAETTTTATEDEASDGAALTRLMRAGEDDEASTVSSGSSREGSVAVPPGAGDASGPDSSSAPTRWSSRAEEGASTEGRASPGPASGATGATGATACERAANGERSTTVCAESRAADSDPPDVEDCCTGTPELKGASYERAAEGDGPSEAGQGAEGAASLPEMLDAMENVA